MGEIQSKTIETKISHLGDIKISIFQIGKKKHLEAIEDFITKSQERFHLIMMQKPELKNPLYFQRALQAFVNHIQESGIEQNSNLILAHFKNWVYSQNGNLTNIITRDGRQSTAAESKQDFRNSVQSELNRRYGNGG